MPVRQAGVRPLTPPAISIVPGLPPVLPPIDPPPPPGVHLTDLTLSVGTIEAGQGLVGTVTIDGPAPAGGVLISLSSGHPGVTVPPSVLIPAGDTTEDFPITTAESASAFTATITATDSTLTETATLSVTATPDPPPPPPPDTTAPTTPGSVAVTAITRTAARVTWGASTDAVGVVSYGVYLNGARVATPAGLLQDLVALTCATVYTVEVDAVDAAGNRSAKSAPLVFSTSACEDPPPPPPDDPPVVDSLSLSPTTIVGGNPVTGTVTLDRVAPTGGTLVTLVSSVVGVAQVPATVLVLAGQTTASFPVTTSPVAATASVSLTASTATPPSSASATLSVNPTPPPPPTVTLSSLTVTPGVVVGGQAAALVPRLSGAAGTGGVAVALVSSNPRLAEVPASVTVPAGQQQASVTVATRVPALAPAALRTVASPAAPVGSTTVTTAAELTAALLLGGTIRLAPNTTFTGQFAVTVAGTKIVGGANSRISGGSAGTPALLVTADNVLVQGDPSTGLELAGPTTDQAVFRVGLNTAAQATLDSVPDGLTLIDVRILSHRGKRGFEINGTNVTLTNCWGIDIWHASGDVGPDSQAIAIYNTQGNVTIRGGKYSAGTEVILVGGDTLKIPGDTTSNILIEDVDIFRPMSWRTDGVSRRIKNLLELKRGSGVTIRRCHLHGCWPGGVTQDGEAFVFTPSDRCVVENVVVEDCAIWDVSSGIEYLGRGQNTHTPRPLSLTFRRNLLITDKLTLGGFGMLARGGSEPASLIFEDNRVILDGTAIVDHFAGTVIEADDVTTRPGGKIGQFTFTGNRSTAPSLGLRFLGQNNGTLIANAVSSWTITGNVFGGFNRMQSVFPANEYLDTPTFTERLTQIPGVASATLTATVAGVSRSTLLTVTSAAPPDPPSGDHNHYYETLAARPDVFLAAPLRSQANIDSYPEAASSSTTRLPIVYDAVEDAAVLTINPPVASDVKGRFLPFANPSPSVFLTWEFAMEEHFRYLGEGYIRRHKSWRFNPGPIWLALRTDYQHAQQAGNRFVELIVTGPSSQYLGPGTWRGGQPPPDGSPRPPGSIPHWYGEGLNPRYGEFFLQPLVWTRVFIFIEDLDQPTVRISVWVADETREAVQLYNRMNYLRLSTDNPLRNFQVEFDTSGDQAPLGPLTHAWTRNYVALRGVALPEVLTLLTRPIG